MIIYNVTVNIDDSVHDEWLEWMKNNFIPSLMSSQSFTENKFYQVKVNADQSPTYTLQLYCDNIELWQAYQELQANDHLKEVQHAWGEKCYYFCTEMQIVN